MESIKKQNWRILHLLVGMVLKSMKFNFFLSQKAIPNQRMREMVLGVTEVHVFESSEGGQLIIYFCIIKINSFQIGSTSTMWCEQYF